MDLWHLVGLILLSGVVVWLINLAPFIDDKFKTIATWVIIVFVVIYIAQAIFGPFPNIHLGR